MQRRYSRTSNHSNSLARREGIFMPRLGQCYEEPLTLPCKLERVVKKNSRRVLAGLTLLLLIGQAPAFAETIVVGGHCTLARAITAANSDTTVGGFCRQGHGPDTIVLPPHRLQVLTRVDNTTYGPTGLPVIGSRISIVGNGSTILRAPRTPEFRIFAVARTGRLTLNRLTIKGGFAPRLGGGGIRSLGFLTMVDVVFDRNFSFSSSGGGLWAQNIVTIIRGRFIRNRSYCPISPVSVIPVACNGGGGFYATGTIPTPGATTIPHLTVDGSTFAGNLADENGGGLQVDGQATINDSTLADNVAQQGGAMAVGTQLASIIKERLDTANTMQPSLHAAQAAQSSVQVTNTILTDNVATISGGGIVVGDGSDLTLNNTVVSGNTAPQGPEAFAEADSFVDTDAFNTFGQDGNDGLVGFVPGPTD
ncbi:MAG TPA: hypothetical protein VHK27_09500, partial [Gammaproteobacteria bacterium]|nr:hypothetical protein [Gammaproteobacteria bacterium]